MNTINVEEEYDVAICGAGPAGASAALSAAKKGLKVLLIDKEVFPRYKACGGAIPKEFAEEIKLPSNLISRTFNNLELHFYNETFSRKAEGVSLWRADLDHYLVKLAQDAGAYFLPENKVREASRSESGFVIRAGSKKLQSRILIAADGVPSTILQQFDWPKLSPNDMAQTVTYEIKLNEEIIVDRFGPASIHLWFGKNICHTGYGWIFPKKDAITVGWGCQISEIQNVKREFEHFLSLVAPYTEGGTFMRKAAHLVPVGFQSRFHDNGLVIIGDVAGFVDPLSGKGIAYGALSGKVASKIIAKALQANDLNIIDDNLEKFFNREFLTVLKFKKDIQADVYSSDEKIYAFLQLWLKHRSSEIAKNYWPPPDSLLSGATVAKEKTVDAIEIRIDKRRKRKKHSEDKSTIEGTFDTSTRLHLNDLMNKGIIKSMGGVISTGKEANVYRGIGANDEQIAIKIYRINSADVKHMFMYIMGDPRFKHVRKKRHTLVFTWAEKELKNLSRAELAEVRVPHPIHCKRNILVMRFIGSEEGQAPKLKEIGLDDPLATFNIILEYIRKLYQKAHLVHADLSEYNILMWEGPVFIDISQAVLLDHPLAESFLFRDLKNILHYFKQFGIPLPSLRSAIEYVTKSQSN